MKNVASTLFQDMYILFHIPGGGRWNNAESPRFIDRLLPFASFPANIAKQVRPSSWLGNFLFQPFPDGTLQEPHNLSDLVQRLCSSTILPIAEFEDRVESMKFIPSWAIDPSIYSATRSSKQRDFAVTSEFYPCKFMFRRFGSSIPNTIEAKRWAIRFTLRDEIR